MLHAKVGWRRLVEAQPSVEAMVAEKAVNPLPVAAQHHAGLRRYAPRFLAAFQFRASRRGDPIAAIELLTQMHRENRRALPNKFPIRHLDEPAKKLILAGGKPDRPSTKLRRSAHCAIGCPPATSGWREASLIARSTNI